MVGEQGAIESKEDVGVDLKDVMEKISMLEDLHNVLQLDIINLKNELEGLKLISSTHPLPEELGKRISEVERITKDIEIFKRWKQTVEEVKFLRERLMSLSSPKVESEAEMQKPVTGKNEEIENLRKEIENLKKEIRAKKKLRVPIDIENLKAAIEENKNAVENLKIMITEKPKGFIPDIDYIREMTKENKRLLDELRMKIETSEHIPSDVHKDIQNLHAEILKLEDEVKRVKEEQEQVLKVQGKGEIDSLKRELYVKLEELNKKFGLKEAEEIKRVIETNKASIEKLKNLVSSEEMELENLKKEINENRKFMSEIKNMLLSKGGLKTKIEIPPDPEMRKKILLLEQKLEYLGKKIEKMSEIKPIKLPELAGRKGEKPTEDIETLKHQLDQIVSRLDNFVTRDEVEKGLLEKHLKSDEKLLTGEIYNELNEIKKAILRNEDHINSVTSDVENIKRELGIIEKTEWGKKGEAPSMEDLIKRIEALEKRMEEMHEGPVLIE
jgi:DNA repair exonuclease SbcCD ATPase subunit